MPRQVPAEDVRDNLPSAALLCVPAHCPLQPSTPWIGAALLPVSTARPAPRRSHFCGAEGWEHPPVQPAEPQERGVTHALEPPQDQVWWNWPPLEIEKEPRSGHHPRTEPEGRSHRDGVGRGAASTVPRGSAPQTEYFS